MLRHLTTVLSRRDNPVAWLGLAPVQRRSHVNDLTESLVDLRGSSEIISHQLQCIAQLSLSSIEITHQNKILRPRLMQANNVATQTLNLG